MESEDAQEAILALVNTSYDVIEEQERLCNYILNEIASSKKSNAETNDFIRTNLSEYQTSVRQFLGNDLSSTTINQLASKLSDLMAHRVDPSMVLPATQDMQANEDALLHSAITLTRQAFLAAKLYATFIAMPGSYGAGLIDVGALSNLNALVRRWCVECTTSQPIGEKKGKRKAKEDQTVTKKSRRDDDEDQDYQNQFVDDDITDEDQEPTGQITCPLSLRHYGLQLARAMSLIPAQPDFLHWSEDATEILLDAVVCVHMTTAALNSKQNDFDGVSNDLTKSMVVCTKNLARATVKANDSEDGAASSTPAKTHNTMLYILRGVFSALSFKMQIPNGQKGKECAHQAGVNMLEGIVEAVSKEIQSVATVKTYPTFKTPAKSPTTNKSTLNPLATSNTPYTGRKERKKRVSFGAVQGQRIESITAPTLKSNTPLRRRTIVSPSLGTPLLSALVGMMQKLITLKELDRADARKQTLHAITLCLPHLPVNERTHFLRFLIQTCHSKISVHRLTGVEFIGKVLTTTWFWDYHSQNLVTTATAVTTPSKSPAPKSPLTTLVNISDESMPRALLGSIKGRLVDRAPAVRSRAAMSLVEIMDHLPQNCQAFDVAISSFLSDMIENLRERTQQDDRATVRKAAIIALAKLSVYSKVIDTDDQDVLIQVQSNVALFRRLCNDSSVAARKAAADAISNLLKLEDTTMSNKFTPLEYAFCTSVLPLVLDGEPTTVNNAVDLFYEMVVAPLVSGEGEGRAWRLLACISECTEQKGASKGEFEALKTMIRKLSDLDDENICIELFYKIREVALMDNTDQHSQSVWCLLEAIVDQTKDIAVFLRWIRRKSVGHQFVTEPLRRMLESCKSYRVDETVCQSLLRSCLVVMSKLAPHLPQDEARQSVLIIKMKLGQFFLGAEIMGSSVSAMIECLRRSASFQELRAECASLVEDLFKNCEEELSNVMSALGNDSQNVDQKYGILPRIVYLCGELSMIGFRSDEDGSLKKLDDTDPIIGLTPKPSKHLLNMIQALLPNMLPGGKVVTPEPARAHAFVTLGKICLRDERFAKDCLNLFARELHQNLADPCIAVQSNALLVLGDLCIKYTNLVDRHLPVMAACLQAGATLDSERSFLAGPRNNRSALVRKHAIIMLSGLLLQDYIKWRGLLFHRFLVASSDSDEGVAALAETTLCGPLLSRYPRLFFNNFVESLFVLNKCTAHPIYMSAATAGDNGAGIAVGFDGIDLSGATGKGRRYNVYQMMLSKMSDEEKIGVAARLAKDVLGAAVQSEGDLGRVCRAHAGKCNNENEVSAFALLSDAFYILTSQWLRVGRVGNEESEEVDESVGTTAKSEQVVAAKGRLLSKISRKHLVEIILPIICNLKSILQASCSPLLKELMRYFAEMFRAYKTEVEEFMANDPGLLQEVEYDAKQFRKSQLTSTEAGVIEMPVVSIH